MHEPNGKVRNEGRYEGDPVPGVGIINATHPFPPPPPYNVGWARAMVPPH